MRNFLHFLIPILLLDDFDNLKNKLGPQTYDCFILYVDEDKSCAERIRDELEKDEELKVYHSK